MSIHIKQLLRMFIIYQQYITQKINISVVYQISNNFQVYQLYVSSTSNINSDRIWDILLFNLWLFRDEKGCQIPS